MEVPSAVLQKLVCERCSGYLSRGPVHLLENTKYLCGRCSWTKEEGIRVEAYEVLAKLMTFPCKYRDSGCTYKVPFLENKCHEEACEYRQYRCPVTEWGQCDWTGPQMEVLEHCQREHPTQVLPENPCTFTYDISRPSLNKYVLFVFHVLFLIQSKVCTASRKIYHSVRLIGGSAQASDFKFTLHIKNEDRRIMKQSNVAPRQVLALQEDASVVTGIDSLLALLGDFTDTSFTVAIEYSGLGTLPSEVAVWCGNVHCCAVTAPAYRGDWLCSAHAPEQRTCMNSTQGCTYIDFNEKCEKHEMYYCEYLTECSICFANITGTTLDDHYTQAHGDIIHRAGTMGTISPLVGDEFIFTIFDCDYGWAVCGCWLHDSEFLLWVNTPLPSAQLYRFRCTVDLRHPETGHTLTCTPAVRYNSEFDWFVCVPRSDYNRYVHGDEINININVTLIGDPSQYIV